MSRKKRFIQQAKVWRDELKNLDQTNYGSWQGWVKVLCFAVLAILVCALCWALFVQPKMAELAVIRAQTRTLQTVYQANQQKVDAFEQELALNTKSVSMQEQLALKQIPSEADMAELMEQINQLADLRSVRLLEVVVQPAITCKAEPKDTPSYGIQNSQVLEHPIRLQVTGRYHQLGHFLAQLVALPRLVTVHDFELGGATATDSNPNDPALNLSVLIKVYQLKMVEDATNAEQVSVKEGAVVERSAGLATKEASK